MHVGMRIFVLRAIDARNMFGIGARVDFVQCSAESVRRQRECARPSANQRDNRRGDLETHLISRIRLRLLKCL